MHQVSKDDVFQDMVRVHRSRRKGIGAGQLCRVTANGATILAVARGSPGNDVEGIWLDDAMRSRLGVKEGTTADFEIKKARWDQEFAWLWYASNPIIRAPGRLAVISFILGLFGLALGLMSLFK
ncbi:MAG: hypothetical protein ACLQNV_19605 [Steroidobacteraceae bacterium]